MAKLPSDPHAAYHLARAAHPLEYTRSRSDPTSGPLACYVIDVESAIADEAADAIPWWHDVHHRVMADGCSIIVGWSPLDAVAKTLAKWDTRAAVKLEKMSGSDVSIWSIAYFGRRCTATRMTYDALLDADQAALWEPVGQIRAAERAEAAKRRAEEGPSIQIWMCGNNRCDHDGDGVEIAEFDHDQPDPSSAESTCSKCGSLSIPRW
jgi:hypothetical protein